MDNKSFGIGLVVASCVWITTIVAIVHMEHNPVIIEKCDLVEDDVIDTEFEKLMIENRIQAYERGYYTCLQDANPDMYTAYITCSMPFPTDVSASYLDNLIDQQAVRYNFNADEKEYLRTLLLD